MIVGLGTDLIALERAQAAWERFGERFAERILAAGEQAVLAKRADPVAYLAGRFAAKEAAAKALGTGMKRGVAWSLLEVAREPGSPPHLILHGAAAEHGERLGVARTWVSLAHDRHHAVATVLLEGEG
jgi:holo-[acyl-carrier protein] synthase